MSSMKTFRRQVENGQHMHFKQLVYGLRMLECEWADVPTTEFHVKFGRIEGMSTRRGHVVLLRDILDEAQRKMIESMNAKNSTLLFPCRSSPTSTVFSKYSQTLHIPYST